jgi:hypothetical protein
MKILSPRSMRCPKCGGQFDPRVQSRACHKGVRHFPIKRVSEWQPPRAAPADKPRQRADFQSDFMLLWDETQTAGAARLRARSSKLMGAPSHDPH